VDNLQLVSNIPFQPHASLCGALYLGAAVHLGSGVLLVSAYKGFTLHFACNYGVQIAPFTSLM